MQRRWRWKLAFPDGRFALRHAILPCLPWSTITPPRRWYVQASLTYFYFKSLLQYILCLPAVTEITQHKFEMARVLLSNCFSTFAHVNFTATPQQSASHAAKRLFFAELMLVPDLQAYEGTKHMRVLHVCTINDSCFGK